MYLSLCEYAWVVLREHNSDTSGLDPQLWCQL